MKKNRTLKAIGIALTFVIVLSSFPSTILAKDNSQSIKLQTINKNISNYDNEIQNNLELLLREKVENGKKADRLGMLTDNKGTNYSVPVYEIGSEEIYKLDNETILAQTYGYYIPEELADDASAEKFSTSLITTKSTANGSTAVNAYDPAGSLVRGYCTIYYTINTDSNGAKTYKLNSVKGNYTRGDLAFSVTKQVVKYTMAGMGPDDIYVQNTATKYPTSSSWQYTTGFQKFITLDILHTFGATYTLTIKRTSSSWNFTIYNLL